MYDFTDVAVTNVYLYFTTLANKFYNFCIAERTLKCCYYQWVSLRRSASELGAHADFEVKLGVVSIRFAGISEIFL